METHTQTVVPSAFRATFIPWFARVLLFSTGGFVLVFWFSSVVPYNMDEFIHYNTIICHAFPNNNLDGQCDPFVLDFLGLGFTLPLRAFHYAGSFPALYYLPLHSLWSSPLLARMLGFWFLSAGAFLIARIFAFRFRWVLMGMIALFPYFFQHIVDTGPVGFHILSVYLLYVLLDRWCATLRKRYAIASAVIVFLGIWTKLSYVWLLPGIVVIFAIHALRHRAFLMRRRNPRRLLVQTVCAGGLAFALVSSIVLSSAPGGGQIYPYINQIHTSASYSFFEMIGGAWLGSVVLPAFLHPLEATQRIYAVDPAGAISMWHAIVLYCAVPAGIIALAALRQRGRRMDLLLPLALYGAFLATVWMILRTKDSWSMHHAILSYPFLILAAAALIRCMLREPVRCRVPLYRAAGVLATVFLLLNVHFYVSFSAQRLQPANDPSKQVLHAVLNTADIADRYIAVIVDWGMFYYQGLYGPPSQSLLFWWGMKDPGQIAQLQEIARSQNRKILFVHTTHETAADLRLIRESFHLERCPAVAESAVWQIIAEPDPYLQHACSAYADYFTEHPASSSRFRATLAL